MVEADNPGRIAHVDWHTSGVLANGSGSARAGYYGVPAVPDVFFDGIDDVLGSVNDDSIDTYNTYSPIVTTHLTAATYAKAIVTSQLDVNSNTMMATVTVDVEVAPGETIGNPQNCSIRAALVENNVNTGFIKEPATGNNTWNYISRAMVIDVPVTFAGNSGDTQHETATIAVDPAWAPGNLACMAWIQRNSNRVILQADIARPQYEVQVVDLDPTVGKTTGADAVYDVQVTYTGVTSDDVVVTLDQSTLPAGWSAELSWNAMTDPVSITIPGMVTDQVENVTLTVTPTAARTTSGLGSVTLTTSPASNTSLSTVQDYHTFLNTPSILFVDDDNGATYETDFLNAIAAGGRYAVTTSGGAGQSLMELYDAVIWNTGELQTKTIGASLQTGIQAYLDGGGKFFLSSQGYLNHQGLTTFTTDYLGVSAFTQDAGATSATGVASDPIGDGLSFSLSPPFTDDADDLTPSLSTTWLEAPGNQPIGVRYDSGTFKTVFLSAPFEGIPTGDQTTVMTRILDWMVGGSAPTGADDVASALSVEPLLRQNAPNPFRGATSVRFSLPSASDVRLEVYDVAGRRVAGLLNGRMDAGEHSVAWDGTDGAGHRSAAGVYLVRLRTGGRTLTRDVVLLR